MAMGMNRMMAQFMLETNLNCLRHPPNRFPFNHAHFSSFFHTARRLQSFCLHKPPSKVNLECLCTNGKTPSPDANGATIVLQMKDDNYHPFEVLERTILNTLKAFREPFAAAILAGLLFMHEPNFALAASGGRVGGGSFSSRDSSSSRSYYSMRTEEPRFSYSLPYHAPSQLGLGGGGIYIGPAVGVGSTFFLIMISFTAFILVSGFLSDMSEGSLLTASAEKTSIFKLQVGLLGLGRSLQSDLNRIAEVADTSTPEGISYVLMETTLALLRHPHYCILAYSSVDIMKSMEHGEKLFNQLSIEERGKFDEETLVNVNKIKRKSSTSKSASAFSNEYIVVTILVAAKGSYKLPSVNGSGDLKEALHKIASIPSSRTLAVEVLWTPQNENDTLSERELLEDYPLLRPL
ncbi:unnamed protein product [Cuscuta epithymum]|uniref:Myelin-associated oligodendrocyte basic protein n=1 Tax=Cuscuta epithymum TaxID=186058 RepID=A0AAV0GA64_9ASTE|nr:unnamed protein product [Cuscuta epithymum]CAH9144742.1 unnamed protein product [Cuscuta epithymum]